MGAVIHPEGEGFVPQPGNARKMNCCPFSVESRDGSSSLFSPMSYSHKSQPFGCEADFVLVLKPVLRRKPKTTNNILTTQHYETGTVRLAGVYSRKPFTKHDSSEVRLLALAIRKSGKITKCELFMPLVNFFLSRSIPFLKRRNVSFVFVRDWQRTSWPEQKVC